MGVFSFVSQPIVGWLNREVSHRDIPLSDFERIKHELKLCDVLLVEGRSRVAEVIRLTTQSPWTHAALYIGRLHDIEDPDLKKIVIHHYQGDPADRLIIESLLGHGTVVHNLDNYANEHLRICRPARLGYKDVHQVIRYAISRLGVDYDVRQIIDLARFLFPWSIMPRKWRSSLFKHNPGRSTRTVCSTMIAEAFAFVQFPILPLVKLSEDEKMQMFRRNPKLCTPSDFDYSPYFKIIKYPFVDIHYHDDHHLLPWHGSSELDEEENELYMDAESHPSPEDVEEAISQAVAISEDKSAEGDDVESEDEDAAQSQDEDVVESQDEDAINGQDEKGARDDSEQSPELDSRNKSATSAHESNEQSPQKPQIH